MCGATVGKPAIPEGQRVSLARDDEAVASTMVRIWTALAVYGDAHTVFGTLDFTRLRFSSFLVPHVDTRRLLQVPILCRGTQYVLPLPLTQSKLNPRCLAVPQRSTDITHTHTHTHQELRPSTHKPTRAYLGDRRTAREPGTVMEQCKGGISVSFSDCRSATADLHQMTTTG